MWYVVNLLIYKFCFGWTGFLLVLDTQTLPLNASLSLSFTLFQHSTVSHSYFLHLDQSLAFPSPTPHHSPNLLPTPLSLPSSSLPSASLPCGLLLYLISVCKVNLNLLVVGEDICLRGALHRHLSGGLQGSLTWEVLNDKSLWILGLQGKGGRVSEMNFYLEHCLVCNASQCCHFFF